MKLDKKSFVKYIISMLLFGINGIVADKISSASYEIVLIRTFLGSIFLLAVFFLGGNRFTFYKKKKQSLMLAMSGISMGLSWLFLYEAYDRISVSIASLVYYGGPVIVMALSPLLFRERLTWSKLAGFAAVLTGIVLVNGRLGGDASSVWGIFCGIMSAVTYAAMVIFNKKAKDIGGAENPTLQLIVSFVTVAVFILIKQGPVIHITQSDIAPILLLGLVNTGLGCYFYFSSIGSLPVQTVAICGYAEPLSAVLFSVLMLNETMSPPQIAGAILIIGGALAAELIPAGRKKSL